jgi:ABC-2 type transport system ATP-binding protein
MDVIACKQLTKRFGPTVAVDQLDLQVGAGQVYGFLGLNGAGKTTTIRMLLGLVRPSGGQIDLLGRRLPDPRVTARTGSMIEAGRRQRLSSASSPDDNARCLGCWCAACPTPTSPGPW